MTYAWMIVLGLFFMPLEAMSCRMDILMAVDLSNSVDRVKNLATARRFASAFFSSQELNEDHDLKIGIVGFTSGVHPKGPVSLHKTSESLDRFIGVNLQNLNGGQTGFSQMIQTVKTFFEQGGDPLVKKTVFLFSDGGEDPSQYPKRVEDTAQPDFSSREVLRLKELRGTHRALILPILAPKPKNNDYRYSNLSALRQISSFRNRGNYGVFKGTDLETILEILDPYVPCA